MARTRSLPKPWPARLFSFGVGAVGQPVAHGHVRAAGQDGLAQLARSLRRVGVVAVHHDVAVRVDVAEHLAHDVALALARLWDHRRTGGCGKLRRSVGRVVVVHVDLRLRQLPTEVGHDLGNRDFLVIAGDQDRDASGIEFRCVGGEVGHRSNSKAQDVLAFAIVWERDGRYKKPVYAKA